MASIPLQRRWRGALNWFGVDLNAPDGPRFQQTLMIGTALTVTVLAPFWGIMYVLFDEPLAGAIPLGYSGLTLLSLLLYKAVPRFTLLKRTQFALFTILPFSLMIALGGFVSSSAVVMWCVITPFGALVVSGRREVLFWWSAFVGIIALGGLIDPLYNSGNNLPGGVITLFFVLNITIVASITFLLLRYFVGQRDLAEVALRVEQERSDRLLRNVLPDEIAELLKDGPRAIAERRDAVSVLFADLVGFTPIAATAPAEEVVHVLNEIFTHFDGLAEHYGVEKIRTIGDGYMVAAGVPSARDDHALVLTRMALDIMAYEPPTLGDGSQPLRFRIGINSGPVVAGVVGSSKYQYDLWGDAVNVASRMESQGVPDGIQVSQETYTLIKDAFVCEPRGEVDVKGRGPMHTWLVTSERL